MTKNVFNIFVGLMILLFGLYSCKGSKPKSNRTDTYSSGTTVIPKEKKKNAVR